jgi:hypothetical protein
MLIILFISLILGLVFGAFTYWWSLLIAPAMLKILPNLAHITWLEALYAGFFTQWLAVYDPFLLSLMTGLIIFIYALYKIETTLAS